jgi:hypothetical protein
MQQGHSVNSLDAVFLSLKEGIPYPGIYMFELIPSLKKWLIAQGFLIQCNKEGVFP